MYSSSLDPLIGLPAPPFLLAYLAHEKTCLVFNIAINSPAARTQVFTKQTYEVWIKQVEQTLTEVKTADDCAAASAYFPHDGSRYRKQLCEKWLGFANDISHIQDVWRDVYNPGPRSNEAIRSSFALEVAKRALEISITAAVAVEALKFVEASLKSYMGVGQVDTFRNRVVRLWIKEAEQITEKEAARIHLQLCPVNIECRESRVQLEKLAYPEQGKK